MEQQVILVTGASAGIGLEIAEQLANKGAVVYAASRRGGESKSTPSNGQIIHVQMDVNKESDILSVINQILADHKKLNTVICNAGNGIAGAVEDTNIDEAKYQFETNYFGVLRTIQACLPSFRTQGYGKIITVSSLAGVIPIPFQTHYSAVKSALLQFMHGLSIELKPFGIQCCTVLPGDTKTEFTAARKYTNASQNELSVYYKNMKRSVGQMEKDEQNGMSAAAVAQTIVCQALSKRMCRIVVPGLMNKFFYRLFKFLPTNTGVWIISKIYG